MGENSDDQSVTSRVKIFGVVVASLLVLFGSGAVFAYLSGWKLNMDAAPTAVVEQDKDNKMSGRSGSDGKNTKEAKDESSDSGSGPVSFAGWTKRTVESVLGIVSLSEEITTTQKGTIHVTNVLEGIQALNGASFVPSSLELRLVSSFVPGSTLSGDRKQVVAPDEGTYLATQLGAIQYTPTSSFVGTGVGVAYLVRDTNGTTYQGRLRPRVVDTAPLTCSDAASQGFWLATKQGYFTNDESYVTRLQELGGSSAMSIKPSSNGQIMHNIDSDGNLLRSLDGGVNYTHIGPNVTDPTSAYAVSDNGNVVVATFAGQSYVSTDTGTNWRPITVPGSSVYNLKMSFTGNVMYQYSFDYFSGQTTVYKSTNQGSNWGVVATLNAFNPYSYDVSDDGQTIILDALDGATMSEPQPQHIAFKSTDAGITWNTFDIASDFTNAGKISLSGDGQTAAIMVYNFATDRNELYISTTGGHTWQFREIPTGLRLNDYTFTKDANVVFAKMDDPASSFAPRYYRSTNLASSWTAIANPDIRFYNGFTATHDGSKVYVQDIFGRSEKSVDFGASWQEIDPIYQPFNEYRVDLDLSTPQADYELDRTTTEGWRLTYDPVTDDLTARITNPALFAIPDVLVSEYSLAPLSGCENPIKGTIRLKYESLG